MSVPYPKPLAAEPLYMHSHRRPASPLHQSRQHADCSAVLETHSCGALHRYAEGLSFQEAYRQLHKLKSDAEYPDMHFTASKLVMQHVLQVGQMLQSASMRLQHNAFEQAKYSSLAVPYSQVCTLVLQPCLEHIFRCGRGCLNLSEHFVLHPQELSP